MPLPASLDLSAINWETEIRVSSVGSLQSYADLAPFLDELTQRYASVSVHVAPMEPPAADFSEIAVTLSLLADYADEASIYVILRFIDSLLDDHFKALRGHIRRILERARKNSYDRRFVPFELRFGGVQFLFHQRLDEESLLLRLEGVKQVIASLPAEAFTGRQGIRLRTMYFWHDDIGEWKRLDEESANSLPMDLWSD